MKTIEFVRVMVPLTLSDIQVENLTNQSLMDAIWMDFRDPEGSNSWEITWDDLKYLVRNGEVKVLTEEYALITC
jgi:hypothetical protein